MLEELKQATLDRVGFGEAQPVARTYEVVATVLGSRDPDQAELKALTEALADRLLAAAIVRAEGGKPTSYSDAAIDFSDDANCEDVDGNAGNAFIAEKRCYRIVAQVSARTEYPFDSAPELPRKMRESG